MSKSVSERCKGMPFVRVASLGELPIGSITPFELRRTKFVLCRTAGSVFAVANECSHDSEPISNGRIRGNEIMCTRHGAKFDLATGAVTHPPALVPIDTYEVRIENDDVLVNLE